MSLGPVRKYSVIAIALMGLLFTASCKKDEKKTGAETLKALYQVYKHGEINECQYNGQIIYRCSPNVYAEGSVMYDQEFLMVGTCNYTSGAVDSKCDKLMQCKTIYRDSSFYSGWGFVDEYGLSK